MSEAKRSAAAPGLKRVIAALANRALAAGVALRSQDVANLVWAAQRPRRGTWRMPGCRGIACNILVEMGGGTPPPVAGLVRKWWHFKSSGRGAGL